MSAENISNGDRFGTYIQPSYKEQLKESLKQALIAFLTGPDQSIEELESVQVPAPPTIQKDAEGNVLSITENVEVKNMADGIIATAEELAVAIETYVTERIDAEIIGHNHHQHKLTALAFNQDEIIPKQ